MRFFLVFSILLAILVVVTGGYATEENPEQLTLQNIPPLAPSQQQVPLEEAELRDIRGPIAIPVEPPLLLYGCLGLLALIIIALLVLFLVRRNRSSAAPPDPGAVALTELQEARIHMEQGEPLRYADRLSDIVRRYIEQRFHIRSTRQTTSEFLHFLTRNTTGIPSILMEHQESLQHCLEKCDMAKFAHSTLNNQGMEEMENSVHHFVTTTSPTGNTEGGG